MSQLKIEKAKKNQSEIWTFSENLNEFSSIPKFEGPGELIINMAQLKMMNSYGIKIWCQWINDHKNLPNIILEECPYIFMKNISAIRNFITPNVTINSFFVPYICEDTDEAENILYRPGIEYQLDGTFKIVEVKNSAGKNMELDVDSKAYFSFLNKK